MKRHCSCSQRFLRHDRISERIFYLAVCSFSRDWRRLKTSLAIVRCNWIRLEHATRNWIRVCDVAYKKNGLQNESTGRSNCKTEERNSLPLKSRRRILRRSFLCRAYLAHRRIFIFVLFTRLVLLQAVIRKTRRGLAVSVEPVLHGGLSYRC